MKEGKEPRPYKGIEKNRNMKVTMISIVVGALGTFTKGLIQALRTRKKRGACRLVDVTDMADDRPEVKEKGKIDKFLELSREVRKL